MPHAQRDMGARNRIRQTSHTDIAHLHELPQGSSLRTSAPRSSAASIMRFKSFGAASELRAAAEGLATGAGGWTCRVHRDRHHAQYGRRQAELDKAVILAL